MMDNQLTWRQTLEYKTWEMVRYKRIALDWRSQRITIEMRKDYSLEFEKVYKWKRKS